MIGQPPRYALEEPVFPFPALAAAADRATLGGPREITLACLMTGRMAVALLEPFDIPVEGHRQRAERARHWIGTLTLPSEIRASALRVLEAAGRCNLASAATTVGELASAAGGTLDEKSRVELAHLAQRLSQAQNELQPS